MAKRRNDNDKKNTDKKKWPIRYFLVGKRMKNRRAGLTEAFQINNKALSQTKRR